MTGRGRKRLKKDDGWGESGGYMAAKVKKLEEQVLDEKGNSVQSNLFQGIGIFVNGYTNPSAFELKQLVIKNGGLFHHYYSREKVSHIIASNLPNSKVANLTDKKVCRPAWITESIAAKKLLPYQDYLLYGAKTKVQPGVSYIKTSRKDNDIGVKKGSLDSMAQSEPFLAHEHDEQTLAGQVGAVDERSEEVSIGKCEETESPESNSMNRIKCDVSEGDSNKALGKGSSPGTHEGNAGKSFRSPSKAGDENFVAEFYNNSRLHHLSTWGAEFKAYVNKLQQQSDSGFPARDKLRELAGLGPGTDTGSITTGKSPGKGSLQRTIMHIDMDCFFVSVGLRNRPDLIGKPVAVTHSKGKGPTTSRPGSSLAYEAAHYANKHAGKSKSAGKATSPGTVEDFTEDAESAEAEAIREEVSPPSRPTAENVFHSMAEIASCSYEARAMGVKNGSFVGNAKKLCPDLVTIPYDFEGYNQVSKILYDMVASYTHDIEAVSCDEMLVDCTDLLADTGATPEQFAQLLRTEIREQTNCNASAGIGPSILIARLATRVAKPNGQHVVHPSDITEFVKDKPIRDLPGVGWSMSKKLQQLGVVTCGDLQLIPLDTLQKELGPKTGQSLYNFCRGEDKRPITMERERKSVSAEINYGIRFTKMEEADKFITSLADEVHNRLVKIGARGKTITLKVKVRKEGAPKETAKFLGHGVCDNVAKSATIAMATDNPKIIAKEALGILHPLRIPADDIRGMGIQISRLETGVSQKGHKNKNTPSILQFTTATKPKHKSPEVPKVSAESTDAAKESPSPQSSEGDQFKVEQQLPIEGGDDDDDIPNGQGSPVYSSVQSSPRLPPLPSLPDFSSPDTSFSELMTRTAVPRQVAPVYREPDVTQGAAPTGDFALPSPSQVDPEVLKELPTDIRLQIQSMIKVSSSDPQAAEVGSGDNIHQSQAAGCSHWTPRGGISQVTGQATSGAGIHSSDGPIEALPSYSQLDPSCLAALPPDMRSELEKAYKLQRTTTQLNQPGSSASDDIHPVMRAQQVSPGKVSPRKSPKKSPSRKSPVFKVPRGRPPGRKKKLSPKKLEFVRQPRIDKINQPLMDENVGDPLPKESEALPEPEKPSINLCGAVTLSEVKAMVKEWVASAEGPEEDDLVQFATYLSELVHDKNLEQVDLVIKYLYRQLTRKQSDSWMTGAVFILEQIQTVVKCVHGAVLSLPGIWRNVL